MQDSAGFQSQQFAEQVNQRRDRYSERKDAAYQQLPQAASQFQQSYLRAQQGNQQMEEHQMQMAQSASKLAGDQLLRQQALEELQWTRELHSTKMIGLQRRDMEAQIALREAQTEKAISDLNGGREYYGMNQNEMDVLIGDHGLMGEGFGKNFRLRKASEEERSAAKKRRDESFQQAMQLRAAGRQVPRDMEAQDLRDLTTERGRTLDLMNSNAFYDLTPDEQEQVRQELKTLNEQVGAHHRRRDPNFGRQSQQVDPFFESTAGKDLLDGLDKLFGGQK